MEKNETAATPPTESTVPPAEKGASLFAEMERERARIKWYGRLSIAAFALYPVEIFVCQYIEFEGGPILLFQALLLFLLPVGISRMLFGKSVDAGAQYAVKYSDIFKKVVTQDKLEAAFRDAPFETPVYEPDKGLGKEEIRELGFFPPVDFYTSDDLIEGKYKGIRFSHADCSLVREETRREKNRSYKVNVTVFRGRIFRFTFEDAFPGELRVISEFFKAVDKSSPSWEYLETESFDFNEKFYCYAKDPIAGLTILKPQVITKILGLREWFEKPLALYFSGNEAFLFLHIDRDTFTVSCDKTVEEEKHKVDWEVELLLHSLEAMSGILPKE